MRRQHPYLTGGAVSAQRRSKTLRIPLLILLAWPLVEIAAFVAVGSQVGVLATLGLVVLGSIAGALLLRVQGLGVVARIRAELAAGRNPARELVHGLMIAVAGLLLILPGFVTDLVGLLLFVPAFREVAWRFLRKRISARSSFKGWVSRFTAQRAPRRAAIELDPGEFRRNPDARSPWRRGD